MINYQTYRSYLNQVLIPYQSSGRKEKSAILDHAEMVTQKDRKTIIRRLRLSNNVIVAPAWLQGAKRAGRPQLYPRKVFEPLVKDLWLKMGQMSARPLKAALRDWLPFYKTEANMPLDVATFELLMNISASTLDRFIRYARADLRASKGLTTTQRATRLLPEVPIATLAEQSAEKPGFMQGDTVGHCGTSTAGEYINSLTLTDLNSAWTANRAMLGKTALAVREQFVDIDRTLPFLLWAVNTDSGSEFINRPMVEYMRAPVHGEVIAFTRSRPYRKNDNCYVEQKNFTHVRALFGYERMEDPHLVSMMNVIYRDYWNPLQNFFVPSMKLKEKIRVGARIIKKYDEPTTPYLRLMNSRYLTEEQKKKLQEEKVKLNPFQLQTDLEEKLKGFFAELRKSKILEAA